MVNVFRTKSDRWLLFRPNPVTKQRCFPIHPHHRRDETRTGSNDGWLLPIFTILLWLGTWTMTMEWSVIFIMFDVQSNRMVGQSKCRNVSTWNSCIIQIAYFYHIDGFAPEMILSFLFLLSSYLFVPFFIFFSSVWAGGWMLMDRIQCFLQWGFKI